MINSSMRYTNTYNILNISQDTLRAINRNPAVAANQVFHNNAYDNLFSRSINNAMSQAFSSFSKTFNASLNGLNQAAKTLSSKSSGLFDQTAATTTSKAFSVTSNVGAALGTYSVQVNRLAKSQVNASKGFSAASDNVLGQSASFTVKQNGKDSYFNVDLSKAKTNGDALGLIAKSINDRGGGINAQVNTENGISQLKVTAAATGVKQAFTLSGQFADNTGLNQVTQSATNAEATISGRTVTSENNTLVSADGQFTVKAEAVMQSAESFTVNKDNEAVVNAVKNFADAYNTFSDFASTQNSKPLALLNRQMERGISSNRFDLESIGVTRNTEGRLEVDQAKLRQALQNDGGQVERITTELGGFAQSIERRTSQALRTPVSRYMDSNTLNQSSANLKDLFNYQMNSQKISLLQNNSVGSILDLSL